MKKLLFCLSLLPFFFLYAETEVEKKWKQTKGLDYPKKVTVGPFDNFQGFYHPRYRRFYFTRNQHVSPHLWSQDELGHETALLPQDFDSSDLVLYENGRDALFVSFGDDSSGQLCHGELQESLISIQKCYPRTENVFGSIHSLFWIDERKVGYIVDISTEIKQLYFLDLTSGQNLKIYEGKFWSPQYVRQKDLILIGEQVDGVNQFRFLDKDGKTKMTHTIALGGVLGRIDYNTKNQRIIFSHYLIDSNKDGIIDASDNSVLFRTSLDNLGQLTQLTTLDYNCNFPRSYGDKLVASCARESFLDLYVIPENGPIPIDWKESDLLEALEEFQSYEERQILYQRLLQIKPSNEIKMRNAINATFLGDPFLFVHEIQATNFYPESKAHLAHLGMVLLSEGEVRKKLLKERKYRLALEAEKRRVRSGSYSSKDFLIYKVFYHIMGKELYRHNKQAYRNHLHVFLLDKNLSFAFRSYFLREYVSSGGNLSHLSLDEESQVFSKQEKFLRSFTQTQSEDKKKSLYKEMDQNLNRVQKNKVLRRILIQRAVEVLLKNGDYLYAQYFSANWKRYSKQGEMEYRMVLEQFLKFSLERAYRLWEKGDRLRARGEFYGVMRGTDELEAHYQTINLTEQKDRDSQKKIYQNLIERNFVGESRHYVSILWEIHSGVDLTESVCKSFLEDLNKMELLHHPLKWMLIGFFQAQLYSLTNEHSWADLAHRSFILAMDAGGGEKRITQAAFVNLGFLHAYQGHNALSLDYFRKVDSESIMDQELRQMIDFVQARSYFAISDFQMAWKQIQKIDQKTHFFNEKKAFYASYAGEYQKAISFYKKLYNVKPEMKLNWGRCLFHLKKWREALHFFQEVRKSDSSLRIRSLAGGYLQQIYQKINQVDLRVNLLQELIKETEMMLKDPTGFYFTSARLLRLKIKQLWQLYYLRPSSSLFKEIVLTTHSFLEEGNELDFAFRYSVKGLLRKREQHKEIEIEEKLINKLSSRLEYVEEKYPILK